MAAFSDDSVNMSTGSSDGDAQHATNVPADSHEKTTNSTPGAEKTISCTSCRKRKLKCDRIKPRCGTCTRLRHDCVFPERRRNVGTKRRNMKELEARLAQVETQLIIETSKNVTPSHISNMDSSWNNVPLNMDTSMTMDFGSDAFIDIQNPDPDFFQDQVPLDGFYSQEVISLGLDEALPPDQMMEDLHQIYFDKFHNQMPMMHKQRYLAALNLPAHMRPPICLRYAVWATAASMCHDSYAQYADVFYQRARKYIERAEMKGHGETFVTIPIAQAWVLISMYEAKKTYFTRAWMSTGRLVRLCLMLGLHRLDGYGQATKQILPPPKDVIDLEERRRTFWAAFYGDRWASSGTGWPMIIDECKILTNLPSSEEGFEAGIAENTNSLREALTPSGASKITPFGGVILSACLFGHNFEHLHGHGDDERADDLVNGEYWRRHREMDNVLSHTFLYLPNHLRLPGGIRDMNIVFLHMNVHASTICLHQAAISTAEKHGISPEFILKCRHRSMMAAEEIVGIMRLITHMDSSYMNSWMGFCLYVAAGIFIQDHRSVNRQASSLSNLEFLLAAMKAIGHRHTITEHFITQIEFDIENSGIHRKRSHLSGRDTASSPKQVQNPFTKEKYRESMCQADPPLLGVLPTLPSALGGPSDQTSNVQQFSGLPEAQGLTLQYGQDSSAQLFTQETSSMTANLDPINGHTTTAPNWDTSGDSSLETSPDFLMNSGSNNSPLSLSDSQDLQDPIRPSCRGGSAFIAEEPCPFLDDKVPNSTGMFREPYIAPNISNDQQFNDAYASDLPDRTWVFTARMPKDLCPIVQHVNVDAPFTNVNGNWNG